MTGHKAQGVTTDRTFVVVDGTTDQEWAYVAMSRGRQNNTLYLANPEPADEHCTHLTHQSPHDQVNSLIAAINRSSTQTAAIDISDPVHGDDIDPFSQPPPNSDVADRVAWQIAKRQTERDIAQQETRGIGLAAGR